jgi:PPOX class probable F420-dependent enzyme
VIDLDGRVVLVTGGGRGVGRGIVEGFLGAGATVMTCGRKQPDDLPAGVGFVAADVRDAEQVDTLVAATVERFGRLDVLVNNAGGSPPAESSTASPRFSTSIVALNLLGPLFCAQRANAVMQGQDDGGVIVNIASVSGMRPSPNTAAYGAAKAGLINLTQTLAMEWAPKVRVNMVTSGLVVTDDRAKTANARRDPRVSLHVTAPDFWPYVVVEGEAELSAVAAEPHDDTVEELVAHYRLVSGEHPDWDDFRRAMVADRRLVLRLRPTRAYGTA